MAIKIEQIGGAGDCEVTGAFSHTEVYVSLLEHFETLTEPKSRCGSDAAKTLEELVTIDATHTFNKGFGFSKIKAIPESIKLESSQVGDVNKSVCFENKLTVQVLGRSAKLLGFRRYFKGRDLVVIATEYSGGNQVQIGSAKFAGKLTEMSSIVDTAVEGEKLCTFVFSDKQNYEVPIYKGDVTVQSIP